MAYRVIHITNGSNASTNSLYAHQLKVQEALNTLGEKDEIYEVQHSQAGTYGEYVSTLIVYRTYEED